MDNEKAMCRVPITATMQRVNGEMVMVSAQWANIPADAIARFLIEKFGLDVERGEN